MLKEHPFAAGVGVGILGLIVWTQRGRIAALFRHVIRSPLAGADNPMSCLGDDRIMSKLSGDPAVAVRQLRRYTFASMQDKSPIVGLTHASYALMCLDLLEETVGRDAIKKAGYDPLVVRTLITKLQDKHAEALRSADPYISSVLALERQEGNAMPGFVMA